MTSFLPETHSEHLLKVLHRTLQHFFAAVLRFLDEWLFDRAWSVRVLSRLEVTPQIR